MAHSAPPEPAPRRAPAQPVGRSRRFVAPEL